MPETLPIKLTIYVARVEIHNDAWPGRPTRYCVYRFDPIPDAKVAWGEGRCRSINRGCGNPAFVVAAPAESGARLERTTSPGGVPQVHLVWPGGRKSDRLDAHEVLHAAWNGWRGLSVDLGFGSPWTEAVVRRLPEFARGGFNAAPAVQPPPPLIDTLPAPAVVQDGVGAGVQDQAQVAAYEPAHVGVPAAPKPPAAVRKKLVVQEWGPAPVGPQPRLSQMSLFGELEAAS